MLIIVTGGGTGGHLFPAMAVMDRLRERGVDVLYVGSRKGVEARRLGADVDALLLPVGGIKGKGILGAAAGAFMLLSAFLRLLVRFAALRPAAVFGTGGFVCVPAVAAAWCCRARVYLQEQNAVPGAAVRLLAPIARTIYLGFRDAASYLRADNTVVSGNPLRPEFFAAERTYRPPAENEKLRIFIAGGSQGSSFINNLMMNALEHLDARRIEIVHQSGERERDTVAAAYRSRGIAAEVFGFSDDISRCYRRAHVVIARAGAMTTAEIHASLRPAVFIPYRYAIYDHQARNAAYFADRNAALLYREEQITPSILASVVNGLIEDPGRLAGMAAAMEQIEFKDSARFIASGMLEDLGV